MSLAFESGFIYKECLVLKNTGKRMLFDSDTTYVWALVFLIGTLRMDGRVDATRAFINHIIPKDNRLERLRVENV